MTEAPRPQLPEPVMLDAATMRVLAHPIRVRLVWELGSTAQLRTGDLAAAVGEPVNKVSYHLKLLAEAGLIAKTASKHHTDGRETWWTLANPSGLTYDPSDPASQPVAADLHTLTSDLRGQLERRSYALNHDRAWHGVQNLYTVHLTRDEADAYWARLCTILDEIQALDVARRDTDFDADVEYVVDLSFLPITVHHPEKGQPLTKDAP